LEPARQKNSHAIGKQQGLQIMCFQREVITTPIELLQYTMLIKLGNHRAKCQHIRQTKIDFGRLAGR
jgi:hypothetical protein